MLTGETKDDFHEATDVLKEHTTNSVTSVSSEASYQVGSNELVDKVSYINNTCPTSTTSYDNTEVWIDEQGMLRERVTTVTTNIYESTKVKRIKRFWSKTDKLDSVKELAISFANLHGSPLTRPEVDLFNSMAVTDGIKFESKYNYFQTKLEGLKSVMRYAVDVYKTRMTEEDILKLRLRIEACNEGAITEMILSDSAETHNQDAWTVVTQVFFATCKKELPVVQILSWYGAKSGAYKPGKWSPTNAHTVDMIITKFLNAHVGLMFTCTQAPELVSEIRRATEELL